VCDRAGLSFGAYRHNELGVNWLKPAFAPQPNIALQLTPTASLLVPCASLRRR
jgi:hypothetical protein